MKWKRHLKWMSVLMLVSVFVLVGSPACISRTSQKTTGLEIQEVDEQLIFVLGRGGNSAVYVGEEEVIVIDTKGGASAASMLELVQRKAGDRAITLVNTHYHSDHIRGNELYDGARVIAGAYERKEWEEDAGGVAYPDLTVEDTLVLDLGDERLMLVNIGQAHTWSDVVAIFERRGILMTGDLIFEGSHPVLVAGHGAHSGKWEAALRRLMKVCDCKVVVPGHGPISDMEALQRMADYFGDIRQALDDEEELAAVREKYKNYTTYPDLSGFERTVAYMRGEGIE